MPSEPVLCWKMRTATLSFGRVPRLMGIVNVTPDSFSDGGRFLEPQAAIDHALRLAEEGADLLDLGAESTRPGAEPVEADEQLRRLLPVLGPLCEQTAVPVSVDTSHPVVARAAVEAGAGVINDVTGFQDPALIALAAKTRAGVVAMHMRGTPRTMQKDPVYHDVVQEVFDYLLSARDRLLAAGVELERIALDPGIGFGKTTEHNLALIREASRFHALGCPVVVGHSRKGFLGRIWGNMDADRLPGTIAVALALAFGGVEVLRVHDVAAVRQALVLFEATGCLGR